MSLTPGRKGERGDSNPRMVAPQATALTTWRRPPRKGEPTPPAQGQPAWAFTPLAWALNQPSLDEETRHRKGFSSWNPACSRLANPTGSAHQDTMAYRLPGGNPRPGRSRSKSDCNQIEPAANRPWHMERPRSIALQLIPGASGVPTRRRQRDAEGTIQRLYGASRGLRSARTTGNTGLSPTSDQD